MANCHFSGIGEFRSYSTGSSGNFGECDVFLLFWLNSGGESASAKFYSPGFRGLKNLRKKNMTQSFVLHPSIYYNIPGQQSPPWLSLHFGGASSVQVLSQRNPTTVTKKKLAQSFVKARLCPPFAFDRPL